MTPQRLVAALAALAVGFGVTLIGVQFDDGDDEAIVTVESAVEDPATTDVVVAADDQAEQEEAPAEPPPAAEVVEGDQPPVATSGGETPPRDSGDGSDSIDDPECEPVLVVQTGSGQIVIFSSSLGEFTRSGDDFLLAGSDESIADRFQARDLELISGVLDDRFESRSVEDCATEEIIEATVLFDFGAAPPDASTSGDLASDATERESAQLFPCSDASFDALLDELDGLEETELIDDAAVFVRVLAKRLAQFGRASVAQWEAEIEQEFDRFVPVEDCIDAIDEVFAEGGGNGFFCAAANVSADARLFDFLGDAVADQMSQCTYIHEEGAN